MSSCCFNLPLESSILRSFASDTDCCLVINWKWWKEKWRKKNRRFFLTNCLWLEARELLLFIYKFVQLSAIFESNDISYISLTHVEQIFQIFDLFHDQFVVGRCNTRHASKYILLILWFSLKFMWFYNTDLPEGSYYISSLHPHPHPRQSRLLSLNQVRPMFARVFRWVPHNLTFSFLFYLQILENFGSFMRTARPYNTQLRERYC